MKKSFSRIAAATALALSLSFSVASVGAQPPEQQQQARASITLNDVARAPVEDAANYILGALMHLKQEFGKRGHDSIVSCMDDTFFNKDGMSGTFDLYTDLYRHAHEGQGSAEAMRFIMGHVRDVCVTPSVS